MKLLPAIDLIGGRCVRLAQGDFAREKSYSSDPAGALTLFADGGASEAHFVDLDGARAGEPRQHALFQQLAAGTSLKLQVAGGFRTAEHVDAMLSAGIERVVIGSLALADPPAFRAMLDQFGSDRLVLALDVRLSDGCAIVATHGWLRISGRTLESVLGDFPTLEHVLVTDIDRDGMLAGPNVELMSTIAAGFPHLQLQASGGVAELEDLDMLRDTRAARVIVGKALWENRFSTAEGVRHARG